MKDFRIEIKRGMQIPLLSQNLSPLQDFEPLYEKLPSTIEEFLLKFEEFNREEFDLHNTQQFLKVLTMEKLIERNYIALLKDYKFSYDKLKRPFLNVEYLNFVKEKEIPLKLFFQLLKGYLYKLLTLCSITGFDLYYLVNNHEGCSICDIFLITNDYSLKFDILYALNKITSGNFFETVPTDDLKSSHYQTLHDILYCYSDDEFMKFLNFSENNSMNFIKNRPIYISIIDNQIRCLYDGPFNKESMLDIAEELNKCGIIYQHNKDLHENPQAYKEHFIQILKEKFQNVMINSIILEEIKNIAFIYCVGIENHNLEYLYLVCYLCDEILKSNKGVHLKRTLNENKNYVSKITKFKFLRSLILGTQVKYDTFHNNATSLLPFLIDFMNITSTFSYNDIYTENEYRKTESFGKIEEMLINHINAMDPSEKTNKNLNFFVNFTIIVYLRIHFRGFIDYAEKMKFLGEQKVDMNKIDKIIEIYYEYVENIFSQIINFPKLLFDQNKYYIYFFKNLMSHKFSFERMKATFEILKRFFADLLELSEKNPVYDEEFSCMSRMLSCLFESFYSDEFALKKSHICEYFIKEKHVERLVDLVIDKHNVFALMILHKFIIFHYTFDDNLPLLNQEIQSKKLYERYLRLNEVIIFEMERIQYDLVFYLNKIIKYQNFSEENDKIRFIHCSVARFYIQKTNRNNCCCFDDRAIKNNPSEDVFKGLDQITEKYENNLMKHLEVASKLLIEFKKNDKMLVFEILVDFYTQIYSLLFSEYVAMFGCFKREYSIELYSNKYIKSLTNICTALYNPIIGHIGKAKQNVFNNFSNVASTFASSIIYYKLLVDEDKPLNYVIVHFIEIVIDKIDIVLNKMIDLTKKDDKRLFKQFYLKDFFNMDADLITDENYLKCVELKKIDFLLNIIKKFNIKQRNSDFFKFNILLDKYLKKLLNLLIPYYFQILDIILLEIVQDTWSIKKDVLFIEYMTSNTIKPLEFAEILCIRPFRLLKNMFLFIKSFGRYRESNNLKIHGFEILSNFIGKFFENLEQNENSVIIENLFENNENYEKFFVNLKKQKIFQKLMPYFKNVNDNHIAQILIKNHESLNILSNIKKNTQFYLKFYKILNEKCKELGGNMNKIGEDVSFILKNLYYRNLFVNSFLCDYTLFFNNTIVFETTFLKELCENIGEYIYGNYEIFHHLSFSNEYDECFNVAVKFRQNSIFESIVDTQGKLNDLSTIDLLEDDNKKNKLYKCYLFHIFAEKSFEDQIKHIYPQVNIKNSEEFLKTIFIIFSNLGLKTQEFFSEFLLGIIQMIIFPSDIINDNNGKKDYFLNYVESLLTLKQLESPNLLYLFYLLLDLYDNSQELNPTKEFLFASFYKDPAIDKKKQNFFEFLDIKLNFETVEQEMLCKTLVKIINVFYHDMILKVQKLEQFDSKTLKKNANNCFFYIRVLSQMKLDNAIESKTLNNIIAVISLFIMKNVEIKHDFIENNVLKDLMRLNSLSKLNEWEYLETFYKLIEILTFDKEFYFYNMTQEILESFDFNFVKKIKKLSLKNFEIKFASNFEKNRTVFIEAFTLLCQVKMNKDGEYMIKLRKTIQENPDFFKSRKYLINEKTIKFLKQLGENILNAFIREFHAYTKKSIKGNYIYSADFLLKFLVILRSAYPIIYEIMNYTPIDLDKESLDLLTTLGLPPLKPSNIKSNYDNEQINENIINNTQEKPNNKISFNEYFINIVIGLGFGLYNTYIIDSNVTKKLKLGFYQVDGKLYSKDGLYIYQALENVLENLRYYEKFDERDRFSAWIALWNYSNFLINLLDKFKNYYQLENFYEKILKESIMVLLGLFKNANKEKLLILQALEIDAKISVLYKEHMRFLFEKKAKQLNSDKKLKAPFIKYYFQKYLDELFEFPEKFKEMAFKTKEKSKEISDPFNFLEKFDFHEEILKWGKENIIKGNYEFLMKKTFIPMNSCMDNGLMIFSKILPKYKKNITVCIGIAMMNTLFDSQLWNTNKKERTEYANYLTKISGEFDRFKSETSIRIYANSVLHVHLQKLNFIHQDNDEKTDNVKTMEEFISEYHQIFCKDLISKKFKAKEESIDLNKALPEDLNAISSAKQNETNIKTEEKKLEVEEIKDNKQENTEINKFQEETKSFIEKEEEKKVEVIEEPIKNEFLLSEIEYKFFEKFYCLLEIEKYEFLTLSKTDQLRVLEKKYHEYLQKLTDKFAKKISSSSEHYKSERENLTLLMCEQYLTSEEDQYMYNELQELKFFLNSLKKVEIKSPSVQNDEMLEKTTDLLYDESFNFDSQIPLENLMDFNINQYPEKKRYQIIDEKFLEDDKADDNKPLKMTDFYNSDKNLDEIMNFEFFAETIDIDEEIILKLFEILCYSIPDNNNLILALTNGFSTMPIKARSTYLLMKILIFNYKNFLRITKIADFLLEEENYLDKESKFPPKNPCFNDGSAVNNNFFYAIHSFMSGISLNFIKYKYASNFFLLFDTNPAKKLIYEDFLHYIDFKVLSISKKTSMIHKIFDFYIREPDFSKYSYEFDMVKSFINALFTRNIEKEQVPKEKMQEFDDYNEKNNGNSLKFYPFYKLENIPNIPNSKILIDILLRHNAFLKKKKIKTSEWFFRLMSKNSGTLEKLLSLDLFSKIINDFILIFENINRVLSKNKDKLIEDSKHKAIDYNAILNAVSTINNNFQTSFPLFQITSKEFILLTQNLIKIAKKTHETIAKTLRNVYQNSSKTAKDMMDIQEKFSQFEKDINESLRFFFLKNKHFIMLFLQLIKIYITVEDIVKLYPAISKAQRNSVFDIYGKLTPTLKAFFRIISFIELKDLDTNKKHDIEFLMNDLSLPAMKRIQTKESSHHEFDAISIEKSLSSLIKTEESSFDEVYNLIYKVQDSMQNIFSRINGKSPSIFRVFFMKHDMKNINLFLKMDYLKKETLYRASKESKYEVDEYNEDSLMVERKHVFDSTYDTLKALPPRHFAQYFFKINFSGESGIDGGGLAREWITLLGKEIFNPDMGLFSLSSNKLAIQPNPYSFIVPNHLTIFKFIGNLIGRIMLETENAFGVTFTKSFLKLLLNKHLNINDFEDIDPQICKNLLWMLENDISDLDQTFCYIAKFFEKTFCIDLIENGREIQVTESNKKDYVKAFCLAKMNKEIRTQTHTLMKGILEIVPHDLISMLTESELGIVLSGITKIDVKDIRNTAILSGYQIDNAIMSWLWEILEEYTDVQRASFHFFISGAFKPPFGGFKNNPISITKVANPNKLPIAHTCSRNMELPNYSNKEILREKLGYAIFEGCSSYEFG